MLSFNIPPATPSVMDLGPDCGPKSPITIIECDPERRLRPHGTQLPSAAPKIIPTGWRYRRYLVNQTREVDAETKLDACVRVPK